MRNVALSVVALSVVAAACGSNVQVLDSSSATTAGVGGGSSATSSGQGGAGGGTIATTATGTSGSGGATSCASLGDACTGCISEQCAEAWCSCQDNAECVPMLTCLAICGDDPTCSFKCSNAHGPGVADAFAVTNCGGEKCVGSCDWATGNPAEPCLDCLTTTCESEFNGCFGSQACTDLYGCLLDCAEMCEDPQCVQQCAQQCAQTYPGGVDKYVKFVTCAQSQCASDCGG